MHRKCNHFAPQQYCKSNFLILVCTMPRIYASIDEAELEQIDKYAREMGISRSQLVSKALETFLQKGGEDLESLHRELEHARTEREEAWRETVQLRRKTEQLSTENDQLKVQLTNLRESMNAINDDYVRCKEDLARCKTEYEKIIETVKLKDDEIAFLRSHVSQLTQSISQLSLKPGEEEVRKKRWWRFWG